jgi:hypothetical protein
MRFRICCSAVLLIVGMNTGAALAELRTLSIPGEGRTWTNTKEGSLAEHRFFEAIDLNRYADGILPLDPMKVIPVPAIPDSVPSAGWTQAHLDSVLFEFSRGVAREDVVALNAATVAGRTVTAGQVLIPRWTSFPRRAADVRLLRRAGLTEIASMANVAESFPRPPAARKYNLSLNLIRLGIFESSMTNDQLEAYMAKVFDGDPYTHFERIDRVGQDVAQYWNLFVDLGRYFPLRLFRLYPSPNQPKRLASYGLYVGQPGTEVDVAGFNPDLAGNLGFPLFTNIARTFPTFVAYEQVPVNTRDTVTVVFDPPKKASHVRVEFNTLLDYDLGEIELYSQGYMPEAVYTTKPIPLAAATLGRVFWDEEKIGDPAKSSVEIKVQTGLNSEPLILYRINDFETKVEWMAGVAKVTDHRAGSRTLGQEIDLNDPAYNLDVREIYSALSSAEREKVRLKRTQYLDLTNNLRRGSEPDLEFWSGAQAATSGQLIPAPSGRPYIQFELTFRSADASAATVVRNLRFEYSAPQLVYSLGGEVAPAVDVVSGKDTTFVLALKALIDNKSAGFNRLQVFTPARVESVEGLSVRNQGVTTELVAAPAGGASLPGAGQYKIVSTADDQFVVAFPTVRVPSAARDTVVTKLRFRGRVIDFRTSFRANAFLDTAAAELSRDYTRNGVLVRSSATATDTLAFYLPQPVEAQDVVDFTAVEQLSDRNSLAVIADITTQTSDLVSNIKVSPNPFSPNGDGVNDVLTVSYDLQRLLAVRPIKVEIYDLSGARVRVFDQMRASGGYSQSWDGMDEDGKVVPPGVYLLRVSAEADDATTAQTRLIAVAY